MAKPGVNVQAYLLQWKFHICTSKEKLSGSYFNCGDNNWSSCSLPVLGPGAAHRAKVVSPDAFLELLGISFLFRVAFRQPLACRVLASAYVLAMHQGVIFKSVLCSPVTLLFWGSLCESRIFIASFPCLCPQIRGCGGRKNWCSWFLFLSPRQN